MNATASPNPAPFAFGDSDERGVLLIHGFTGTPYEVRPLGEALAARGLTAVGPLLPGHGQTAESINRTTWVDWTNAMSAELDLLRRRCRRVAVVGMSLGGLIALHLAARARDLAALCVLGTPLWLPTYVTLAVQALSFVTRARVTQIPKPGGGSDIRDPDVRRTFPSLKSFPLVALRSLIDFMPRVRAEVHTVVTPTLVVHGDHDHTAPPACAPWLLQRLASTDKRLLRLPRSYHLVLVDVERERVCREAGDFIAERF